MLLPVLKAADNTDSPLIQSTLFRVADEQKRMWTLPTKLLEPKVAIPTAAVIAGTAALIATDAASSGYFRGTNSFASFNRVFNGNITGYGTLATPVVLFAAGRFRKDSKMTGTAFAAGEALVNAEGLAIVMKGITGRASPTAPQQGWFQASGSSFLGNGSFPSGHAISAFAVATVISRRYGNHRWVPWVAYGLAGAVGFSRVSSSAHFASDAFLGAALGYSVGRFAVLRQ
ncbi:MAG TPA: phosphatase PAP2 family protein [Bryobacteraceae bacterium]|nr:phosphatase PAP2 family protein [Bryobacteraceae bacterium]